MINCKKKFTAQLCSFSYKQQISTKKGDLLLIKRHKYGLVKKLYFIFIYKAGRRRRLHALRYLKSKKAFFNHGLRRNFFVHSVFSKNTRRFFSLKSGTKRYFGRSKSNVMSLFNKCLLAKLKVSEQTKYSFDQMPVSAKVYNNVMKFRRWVRLKLACIYLPSYRRFLMKKLKKRYRFHDKVNRYKTCNNWH